MMGMSISNYGTNANEAEYATANRVDPSLESDRGNINANFSTDRFELPLIFALACHTLETYGQMKILLMRMLYTK